MIANDGIVDENVKKMEKEDLKKVECLRGRLIAERAASKLAKQEAQEMECKVEELETKLKSETKLRKRAHKKLKYLINKLHSLNIPYLPKYLENSDTYSVSSVLTQVQDEEPKALMKIYENGEKKDNVSHIIPISDQSYIEPAGFEPCQNCNNANVDNQRLRSPDQNYDENEENKEQIQDESQSNVHFLILSRLRSLDQNYDESEENKEQIQDESQSRPTDKGVSYVKDNCYDANENNRKMDGQRDAEEENKDTRKKDNEAQDDYVDESLALVLVDLPKEASQVTIDPLILDANVKQVLEALDRAKQRLIWSMENRHMIRIGSK